MIKPDVIPYPEALQKLKRGFDHLAQLLAITLGPTQGVVLSENEMRDRPEVLSDAATIARRVIELPDRGENVGAMLLRNLVWRMHERVGDGGAIAAVLSQAILDRAVRYAVAGVNPVVLQAGIRKAASAAAAQLKAISQPVQGEDDLVSVVQSVTGQPELSCILGEMFDLLGPQAHIVIEDYMAPYLERVYLDGGLWLGRLVSPYLMNAPGLGRAVLDDCQVALFDGNISQNDEIQPLLELAISHSTPHLLLVAHAIQGEALNTLVATHQRSKLKIVAAALKRAGEKAHTDLQDLAVLSGAALISLQSGRRLASFQAGDFGRARRAEAGTEDIQVSGRGDSDEARRQVEILQSRLRRLPIGDEERGELEMRLGRLAGGIGVLKIGALTQSERDFIHQKADQGIKAVRATLEEGVVPGGCTAFLYCIPAVEALLEKTDGEEALGIRAVLQALDAPFNCLLRNAGVDTPGILRQEILTAPPGQVYDVLSGRVVEARQARLLDSTKVIRAALESAVSGASLALSTETVILKRKPKISYEP
ncbi:MAG: hypothetical protein JXB15_08500 [Anaerolineales bacterium]|nr:hypothetical protein [Anaerolineales bacterium]